MRLTGTVVTQFQKGQVLEQASVATPRWNTAKNDNSPVPLPTSG